jgi:hypothetical protein
MSTNMSIREANFLKSSERLAGSMATMVANNTGEAANKLYDRLLLGAKRCAVRGGIPQAYATPAGVQSLLQACFEHIMPGERAANLVSSFERLRVSSAASPRRPRARLRRVR